MVRMTVQVSKASLTEAEWRYVYVKKEKINEVHKSQNCRLKRWSGSVH
jgi:hypothetical protein